MSVALQYQVSLAFPSKVGGTSGVLQYFFNNPAQSLWNVGVPGVNPPQQSSQLGQVPSATSSLGMLPFDASGFKLQGGRLGLYASGVFSCTTGTPTVTPVVQIVTPNATTGSIYTNPVYTDFLGGIASSALVANQPVAFSFEADMVFDPSSGTLAGTQQFQIVPQSPATALVLTQVSVSGTSATYTGTITGGGSSALAGQSFQISGFTNAGNNVYITVVSSTATTLVATTSSQVNETHAGTATGGGTPVNNGPGFYTAIQGLVVATPVNPNVPGQQTNEYGMNPGFGFVVGVTFSAGNTGNSASLYEFKIVQH
jgi:hypothetical protein